MPSRNILYYHRSVELPTIDAIVSVAKYGKNMSLTEKAQGFFHRLTVAVGSGCMNGITEEMRQRARRAEVLWGVFEETVAQSRRDVGNSSRAPIPLIEVARY